jgi:signal transduction histidine kinase/ligand-binding sensor domain-containing protein/DNA-binding response OmpR family regulator
MSIYQDELGRMWFGTMEGISRYDGIHITTYKPLKTPEGNDIPVGNKNRSIVGDTCGNVYFLSDYALIRYSNRSEQFTRLRETYVSALTFHKGEIWVGIADSLFVWDAEKECLHFRTSLKNEKLQVHKIFIDSQNILWVGTNNGLYVEDENHVFHTYIPSEDIYELFEDSRKNIWISTRYKNFYRKKAGGLGTPYVTFHSQKEGFGNENVRCFVEDDYGNIWIGSFLGLVKYNPFTDRFTVYRKDDLPGSLWHSSVFSLYKDKQGSIWVGTYYGGVHHFNPMDDIFTLYSANANRDDCLSFSFVGKMVEDKNGDVWICTEGGGLNRLDRKTGKITHYSAEGTKNSIAHNNLKSICYSEKYNKLYIGTHMGGLSIFDLSSKQFKNLQIITSSVNDISKNVVNQVEIYKDEYLILLTQNGFFKLDLQTERMVPLFNTITNFHPPNFAIDANGFLWSPATGNTIRKINLENELEQTIYTPEKNGLGKYTVLKIFQDKKGRIFLGTEGSGLYRYDREKEHFSKIADTNGQLKNSYCYDIAESLQAYLVILNDKGIAFYHPDQETVKNVDIHTALPISGVNLGCGLLVCRNGEIFAGGIDGMTSFFEQELFAFSPVGYEMYFSKLYVNNEIVLPGDATHILKVSIPFTSAIELKHNQNNLIFSFTTNNYTTTLNQLSYEYMLDGFDKRWIVGNDCNISYTNLNPGHYTLVVREQKTDPTVKPRLLEIDITIHPSIYASPLFYCIYFLLATGIIYGFYRFKRSQLLLRTSLEIERKEKKQNEELNRSKLQFFMNISHEFRTPLTLIISQIENLLQSNSLSPYVYNKLLKIFRNTHYFRGLISELLDFRKLEQGHIKLQIAEKDIISFVKEIYFSFYEYADNSQINYRFLAPESPLLCQFDPKQMQKVFYNLLSNAFKYTLKGGSIEVIIEDNEKQIVFKIIDNGVGIEKSELDRIFDRFYQAGNNTSDLVKASGSGIGLSLVKGIVELHHGNIRVESTPGYGSIFIVGLQKGSAHFTPEEMSISFNEPVEIKNELPAFIMYNKSEPFQDLENKSENEDNPKYRILLVEDNKELLDLLENLFSETYQVILAYNGKDGLEKARTKHPDIIVSDIMMPEMSGTEMCLKIKNDFEICHIPVVLLTAFASFEQNLEGFRRGADDYISKPFNSKLLLARCNNLLRNRTILRKKFGEQKHFEAKDLTTNPIDRKFIDSVSQVIEKNLSNSAFNTNELARELALSRSSLYSKFKVLTGMTPNDFVLNYRLKRAAALLKENTGLQIADIAMQLGFGSSRYFSRCFKVCYGMTPGKYRRK